MTSYSACARALDIPRKNIRDAVYIKALCDSLPVRFSEGQLTSAVGRRLLALDKESGRQALLKRVIGLNLEVEGVTCPNCSSGVERRERSAIGPSSHSH